MTVQVKIFLYSAVVVTCVKALSWYVVDIVSNFMVFKARLIIGQPGNYNSKISSKNLP